MKTELNVNCICNDKLSCLQRPIVTILNWCEKDYRYIFASSWNFTFNFMENYEGIISVPELVAILDNANKYTGISFSILKQPVEQCIETIKIELSENRPVITYIDSFWCPWFPSYMKSHVHHYILIIGIDTDNEFFICLDKLDMQERVILPYIDYINGAGELLTFSKNEGVRIDSVLSDAYESLNPDVLKENICLFANQVENILNVEMQLKDYHDARVSPLYTWLKGIANDRLNYASFLQMISPDNYRCFIEKLETISNDWRSVLILLIRAGSRMQNTSSYKNIGDKIRKIAECEYILMNELKDRLRNESNKKNRCNENNPIGAF